MPDDTTTYVETTTTTVEHEIPTPSDGLDESMTQTVMDRLDAISGRLDKLETPDTTIIVADETTVENDPDDNPLIVGEPAPEDDPDHETTDDDDDETQEPGETRIDPDADPITNDPNDNPADPPDEAPVVPSPDPDKPYADRPEIENDPYAADAKAKPKKRDRTPRTPRSWRTALLGGSGGIRTGGK